MLAKSKRASQSASALHLLGDADGACNRAYYAMFDAASAALLAIGQDIPRTHSGVIGAFSLLLVKDGPVPKDIGRMLKRAEEARLLADYAGDSIDLPEAHTFILQAQEMITCIEILFFTHQDKKAE